VLKAGVIAKNPQLADALVRGTMDGLAFMRAQPEQAVAIIARTLEITPAEVREQLPNIENPDLAHLGDVFKNSDALPSFFASGKLIGGILVREGQIDTLPPIESTFDARFVTALQAAGEKR
jgi:NitT/TauT family transport system substrate-binding protein